MSSSTSSRPASETPATPQTGTDAGAQADKSDADTPEVDTEAAADSATAKEGKEDKEPSKPEQGAEAKDAASTDEKAEDEPEDGDTEEKYTSAASDGAASPETASAKPEDSETATAKSEHAPKDAEDQAQGADTSADAAEPSEDKEETLDLRALFASSEPEFASPTETFEMARGAKPEARSWAAAVGGKTGSQPDATDDGDLPFDLPAEAALNDRETADGTTRSNIFTSSGLADAPAGDTPDAFSGSAPGDPLADAVQSALRSVYGDGDKNADDDPESDITDGSGPVLQWAGSQSGAGDTDDAARFEDALNAEPEPDAQPQANTGIDEETTEAVLNYLYEIGGDTSDTASTRQQADTPAYHHDEYASANAGERLSDDAWLSTAQEQASPDDQTYARADESSSTYAGEAAQAPVPAVAPAQSYNPPMNLDPDGSEASGKLLGAAGLGLIGGIAVAGVAAVFVFNSFVTQEDISGGQAPASARANASSAIEPATASVESKDDSRLGETETASTNDGNPREAATSATATQTAALPDSSVGETSQASDSIARLDAGPVTGRANQAIPLSLRVPESGGERFVRIDGLPEGVKLSAGVDTGNGSWLLSAGRADGVALSTPSAYVGDFTLEAQLLGADARTPLSDPVGFEVSVDDAAPAEAGETRTAALDPETAPAIADQPPTPVERARSLMSAGDLAAAREILRAEADSGNAQAALALGETYDPMTFDSLSGANASPDATEAFRWYQKAAELGEARGQTKMSALKDWLLR